MLTKEAIKYSSCAPVKRKRIMCPLRQSFGWYVSRACSVDVYAMQYSTVWCNFFSNNPCLGFPSWEVLKQSPQTNLYGWNAWLATSCLAVGSLDGDRVVWCGGGWLVRRMQGCTKKSDNLHIFKTYMLSQGRLHGQVVTIYLPCIYKYQALSEWLRWQRHKS